MGFRKDINGLRAWAVIVVLLFHFGVPGFSAGFIGVDIFFVISGFLMTGIIVRGLEAGNFSLWQFYMARARRIVPALMLLLVILLAFGWFWLPTLDYQELGSESVFSLAFLSNFYYWRSAGYFDSAAHEKWLLHTWSLGVEMQFYLLYPIFALVVWKIKPGIKSIYWGLVGLFVVSFSLGVVVSNVMPVAAFYLLPTRGWELAVGGLVYFWGRMLRPVMYEKYSRLLYVVGFLLWLAGFALIDSRMPWPSGWALFPVAGTALIILAQQVGDRLLVNSLAQWFGNISYSLYLWHWPLVVVLYLTGLQQRWGWVITGLVMSLLLGWLSFKLVEDKSRKLLAAFVWGGQFAILTAVAVVIGFLAIKVKLVEPGLGRLPENIEAIVAEKNNRYPRADECIGISDISNAPVDCYYNDLALGGVSVGDSHNYAVFTALGAAAESYGYNSLHWAKSGCPLLKGAEYVDRKGCLQFNEQALQRLGGEAFQGVPLILMSRLTSALFGSNESEVSGLPGIYFTKKPDVGFDRAFQAEFKEAMIDTVCELSKSRTVYMVRPIPEMRVDVPNVLARNLLFGSGKVDSEVKIARAEYDERHKAVFEIQDEAAALCDAKILDPTPYLCDDDYCYGSRGGFPLYFDDDHLSEYGNKLLVPMFKEIFNRPQ